MNESMGWALSHLKDGPAVITLRHRSPTVKAIETKDGASVVQLDELIEFRAVQWREIQSDNWEFVVEQLHPESRKIVRALWYVNGKDVLFVQAQSKLTT